MKATAPMPRSAVIFAGFAGLTQGEESSQRLHFPDLYNGD
jgi:hypothetical protein